jgi:hypothetical protein
MSNAKKIELVRHLFRSFEFRKFENCFEFRISNFEFPLFEPAIKSLLTFLTN